MGYVGDSYTALKTSVNSFQARTRRGPVQVRIDQDPNMAHGRLLPFVACACYHTFNLTQRL